jgi:HD-GYP domain-containing protein (c-di-GMP phosphodiesterase class II)
MEKLVNTSQLRPGLFVSRLDRPWLDTPFLLQGFVIRGEDEIEELRRHCNHVYIDPERGEDIDESFSDAKRRETRRIVTRVRPRPVVTPSGGTGQSVAPDGGTFQYQVPMEQEVEFAFDLHRDTRAVVSHVLEDVRLGKSIDAPAVKQLVGDIAESVLRNPDAMVFLTQLRAQGRYLEMHSINVCIFALVFGRYLGIAPSGLRTLGLGALLHDVGYTRLPKEILDQPGKLTPDQYNLVKSHVMEGVRILEDTPGIPEAAVDLVRDHHERSDGTGYPRGVQGKDIGLYGVIGGIVDTYDALTTDRPWREGVAPYEALGTLHSLRKLLFSDDLVSQFIESIGIYPVGSIVELDTGDIGVVVASHPQYRLLPTVRLLVDAQGQRYAAVSTVDLRAIQGSSSVKPITIKSAVRPAQYGIGPQELIASGFQS